MGNTCGRTLTKDEKVNKRIEDINKVAYENEIQKIKLLLLGAGESGKSTLFKQMKILYGSNAGFTNEERKEMKNVVHQNIVFNFKQLLCSPALLLLDDETKSPLQPQNKVTAIELLNQNSRNLIEFSADFATRISDLWKDEAVQKAWRDRGKLQVQDALEYYLQEPNCSRILGPEYSPTDQDILRSRVRTSGIVEEEFAMEGNKFVMVDVGGQRNERRKWIHAFEDVDCVIFVAAVSEYNQVLYEDNSVKRQDESLDLFKKVATEDVFSANALVLFLNKCDLFRKKLLTIPFRVESKDHTLARNVDYIGPVVEMVRPANMSDEDFERSEEFEEVYLQSLQYLEQLYRQQVPPSKQVFVKTTCATDTQQIRHIMMACKEIFMRKHLRSVGFV